MEVQYNYLVWILLLIVWTIPWKALALWKSARNNQKVWFVIFLLINSLAILEIVYLIISKKRNKES